MRKVWAVATVLLLTAAACGGGGGGGDQTGGAPPEEESNLPQEIGEGEGELNLVAWSGYVESGENDKSVDWVTDFEKETGCKVKAKYGDTSDEMVTLMRQGDGSVYDGVSASGDASNRLIAGGDVAEVNMDLIEGFDDVMTSFAAALAVTGGIQLLRGLWLAWAGARSR